MDGGGRTFPEQQKTCVETELCTVFFSCALKETCLEVRAARCMLHCCATVHGSAACLEQDFDTIERITMT